MLSFEILLIAVILAILLITQVALPLIFNLPCFWLFSSAKRTQVNFTLRVALGEKPSKKNQPK